MHCHILNRRIDFYMDAWTKFAKAHEGDQPDNMEGAIVERAFGNLLVSVTALKQAYLTSNQINLFID